MNVTITKDGQQTQIELKGLKGRMIKQLIKLTVAIQKAEDPTDATLRYLEELDNVASQISGLTVEELDDLDIEDKNKITGYIGQKVQESLGFTTPSTR